MSSAAFGLALKGTELEPDVFQHGVPHELFAQLRREARVAWYPQDDGGYWCVTRHSDVVAVSKDTAKFSSERGGVAIEELDPLRPDLARSMLTTDPPAHRRLRRAVLAPLQARTIAVHEQFLRAVCCELLDEVIPAGEFDFSRQVAHPLPVRALAHVLGVPDNHDTLARLARWPMQVLYSEDQPDGPRALDVALDEIAHYGRELVTQEWRSRGGKLIAGLVSPDLEGGALTDEEIAYTLELFLIAGSDSTRQTLTHGMLAFAERPDQWAQLRANRALIPSAVEEMLRWASAALSFRRTATCDVELGGQEIREGDRVVLWYVSANFDERAFEEPLRFDITRKPNPHCAFGGRGGPHMCVGANLARLELRVILGELVDRVATIEVAGPVHRLRSNMDNGIDTMRVRVGVT